ncbi:serine/threonine protein kinase [Rhodocaloribacter sp.]
MTPERWQQIKAVFLDVLERPPEERTAYLERVCEADETLLGEVRALLEATGKAFPPLPRGRQGGNPPLGSEEPKILPEGTRIAGRYRILRLLGVGGMGAVYEAVEENPALGDRRVALKQTRPANQRHFEREVMILAQLDHPCLPKVYALVEDGDGHSYLAMQLIRGEDLGALLRQREQAFDPDTVLAWAETLLETLDYVHTWVPPGRSERGERSEPILHLDIKPGNLVLEERGHLFLLDFGIARSGGLDLTVSDSVHRYASFSYASPEQLGLIDEPVSERSDLYSLSATLWNLITGRTPPNALSRFEAVQMHETDPLDAEMEQHTEISSGLRKWFAEGLALDPDRRPAQAREMLDALRGIRAVMPPRSLSRLRKSRLVLLSAALLMVFGLLAWNRGGFPDLLRAPLPVRLPASEESDTHPPDSLPARNEPVVSRTTTGKRIGSAAEREGETLGGRSAEPESDGGRPVGTSRPPSVSPPPTFVEAGYQVIDLRGPNLRIQVEVDGEVESNRAGFRLPFGDHFVAVRAGDVRLDSVVLRYRRDGKERSETIPARSSRGVTVRIDPPMQTLRMLFYVR